MAHNKRLGYVYRHKSILKTNWLARIQNVQYSEIPKWLTKTLQHSTGLLKVQQGSCWTLPICSSILWTGQCSRILSTFTGTHPSRLHWQVCNLVDRRHTHTQ